MQRNKERDFWHDRRQPSAVGGERVHRHFLAIRALKEYGRAGDREARAAHGEGRASGCSGDSEKRTEDRGFSTMGLEEAGANKATRSRWRGLIALQGCGRRVGSAARSE